jgi:hypothetical protein
MVAPFPNFPFESAVHYPVAKRIVVTVVLLEPS